MRGTLSRKGKFIARSQGNSRKGARSIAIVSVLLDELGVSKNTSRISDSLGGGGHSARSCHHSWPITARGCRARSAQGPGGGWWSPGDQPPASSPVESHRTCSTPPEASRGGTCTVLPSRDTSESAPRVFTGRPVPQAPSARHPPSPQTRRTAGTQYWPRCLYTWFRTGSHLPLVGGGGGPSPGPSSQMPAEGPPWKQAFWGPLSWASVLTLLHILLILRRTWHANLPHTLRRRRTPWQCRRGCSLLHQPLLSPALQRLLAPGSVSHVDLNRSQVFPSSVCLQCLPSTAQHRKHRFGVFFLTAYFHKTLTLKDDSNELDPLRHIRLTLSWIFCFRTQWHNATMAFLQEGWHQIRQMIVHYERWH